MRRAGGIKNFEIQPVHRTHTQRLSDIKQAGKRAFFILRDPIDVVVSGYWELRNQPRRAQDRLYSDFSEHFSNTIVDSRFPSPNDFFRNMMETDADFDLRFPLSYRYALGTRLEYVDNEDAVEFVIPFWDLNKGYRHLENVTGSKLELNYQYQRSRYDYERPGKVDEFLSHKVIHFLMHKLNKEYELFHYIRYSDKLVR